MEFDDDQENFYRGSDRPIYGAIFMANTRTKNECLKRKLFGLPPPQANFVKKLKSGMMLFLFEHEERKLYGVFQASSDGAMDIVPHAFTSSGKHFPAQIRIKPIWCCKPLSEREFRPAISDNYYAAYKFNLGLSKDQVSDLLWLFESRKIRIQTPKSLLSRDKVIGRSVSSDFDRVGVYEDDVYIRSDSGNGELSVDNELVSLNRDPGLSRSNINVSRVSDKRNVVPDSSIFRNQHGLSNLEHANSQLCSPYRSVTSNAWCGDTSTIGLNVSNSPQAYAAYPMSSADGLFPSSKSQVVPFHIEKVELKLPPTTSGSMDVTTSFEDYIPLDSQSYFQPISSSMLSPQYLSSGYKTENSYNNLEPEPYMATLSSSRHIGSGREKVSSSCSPVRDPLYVPDHHYPAALRHEGPLYSNYQQSDATMYKSHLPVSVKPLDSPNMEFQGKQELDMPTNVERDKYGAHVGLRSDLQNNRISAFSRLNASREDTVQEENDYIDSNEHANVSVNQLMDILCQRQEHWRGSTIKCQHNIKLDTADNSSQSENTQIECEGDALATEMLQCNDTIIEEFPVNFKRRSKTSKMEGENKGRTEESDSNTSARKKRKLLRPSFASERTHAEGIIAVGCPNVGGLSHEIIECKIGSREAVNSNNRGEVNGEESSQSVGIQIVVPPVSFEHNRSNIESSSCKKSGSSDAHGSTNGDEREPFHNNDAKIVVHPVYNEQNRGTPEISSDKDGVNSDAFGSSNGDEGNEKEQSHFEQNSGKQLEICKGKEGEAVISNGGRKSNENKLFQNCDVEAVHQVSFEHKTERLPDRHDFKVRVEAVIKELNGIKDYSSNRQDASQEAVQ